MDNYFLHIPFLDYLRLFYRVVSTNLLFCVCKFVWCSYYIGLGVIDQLTLIDPDKYIPEEKRRDMSAEIKGCYAAGVSLLVFTFLRFLSDGFVLRDMKKILRGLEFEHVIVDPFSTNFCIHSNFWVGVGTMETITDISIAILENKELAKIFAWSFATLEVFLFITIYCVWRLVKAQYQNQLLRFESFDTRSISS